MHEVITNEYCTKLMQINNTQSVLFKVILPKFSKFIGTLN